jgi:hypothetical protein
MSVSIKKRPLFPELASEWDVDGGGVACITLPGIPPTTEQCTMAHMDDAIAVLTTQKERITMERDRCQAALNVVTQTETDMIALRATVTSDP